MGLAVIVMTCCMGNQSRFSFRIKRIREQSSDHVTAAATQKKKLSKRLVAHQQSESRKRSNFQISYQSQILKIWVAGCKIPPFTPKSSVDFPWGSYTNKFNSFAVCVSVWVILLRHFLNFIEKFNSFSINVI